MMSSEESRGRFCILENSHQEWMRRLTVLRDEFENEGRPIIFHLSDTRKATIPACSLQLRASCSSIDEVTYGIHLAESDCFLNSPSIENKAFVIWGSEAAQKNGGCHFVATFLPEKVADLWNSIGASYGIQPRTYQFCLNLTKLRFREQHIDAKMAELLNFHEFQTVEHHRLRLIAVLMMKYERSRELEKFIAFVKSGKSPETAFLQRMGGETAEELDELMKNSTFHPHAQPIVRISDVKVHLRMKLYFMLNFPTSETLMHMTSDSFARKLKTEAILYDPGANLYEISGWTIHCLFKICQSNQLNLTSAFLFDGRVLFTKSSPEAEKSENCVGPVPNQEESFINLMMRNEDDSRSIPEAAKTARQTYDLWYDALLEFKRYTWQYMPKNVDELQVKPTHEEFIKVTSCLAPRVQAELFCLLNSPFAANFCSSGEGERLEFLRDLILRCIHPYATAEKLQERMLTFVREGFLVRELAMGRIRPRNLPVLTRIAYRHGRGFEIYSDWLEEEIQHVYYFLAIQLEAPMNLWQILHLIENSMGGDFLYYTLTARGEILEKGRILPVTFAKRNNEYQIFVFGEGSSKRSYKLTDHCKAASNARFNLIVCDKTPPKCRLPLIKWIDVERRKALGRLRLARTPVASTSQTN